MKNKVYVGTSLLNAERAKAFISRLMLSGVDITYDWTDHDGSSNDVELKEIAINEFNGVKNCDIFVMIHPARNGSHFEFGVACALNKPVIIIQEFEVEKKSFYYLNNVKIFNSENNALTCLFDLFGDMNRE